MADFEQAVRRVLDVEKGYVNHPDDPGGETNCGITKRDFPDEDIVNMTPARAKQLYKARYWDPLHLDELRHQGVANKLLDMSVNLGMSRTGGYFQRALNYILPGRPVTIGGKVGPATIAQANAIPDRSGSGANQELVELALCAYHSARYIELVEGPDLRFDTFSRGWLVRALGVPR